jgi:hypothetical protein
MHVMVDQQPDTEKCKKFWERAITTVIELLHGSITCLSLRQSTFESREPS